MHSLQKQFHDFIYTHQLVGKGEKILLAVSGGVDSMVMCSLFRKEQIDFAIAHCNFGLRGLESDGDEALVIEWATQNRVSYFIESFDLTGGSIQLEARNKRYRWFQQLANENGFQKIATAHHLNDSLETILMNLTRGTGYKGIAGIPVATDNIIRPLLFASKKDLIAYAQEDKIAWREDSSNVKDDYGRNRVRHHVIPELEKLNPSLLTSFSLTSERLRYSSSIINERVDKIRDEYFSKEGDSGFKLNLSWLTSGQDLLILSELLSEFDVNYATAKEIYSSIGKSGKTFLTKYWLIT
ncbi:MAG: tRNA lysidine(34) synthetase TilS, partial [Bacteroidota bacterium]